jgi:Icc-related predicted phosphoesterase
MRLVIISDTHLNEPVLPDGDVLIHCGDMLSGGHKYELSLQAHYWFETLGKQFKHFLFVPGNHDRCFEQAVDFCNSILMRANVEVLVDREFIIDDIKFYGSPWQPDFYDWAFNLPRGGALRDKWKLIPSDTDVLITHGPPFGILDYVPWDDEHVGCVDLYEQVLEIHPKIHCFGHIHGGYGELTTGHTGLTKFFNASICNEQYVPVNAPHVVDI